MAKTTSIEISQPLLRTLHRIQSQRTELVDQIGRGPRQIKATEALVAKAEAEVAAARDALQKAKMVADEKQLSLQTREAHIHDLQAKLNAAASNKEFSLLKDQIAADEQANSVQSDEIFETLESIDVLAGKLKIAEDDLARQQTEHAQRVKEIEAKLVDLNDSLDRVTEQLKTAEAELPPAVKADYLRLTASRGEDAMAPLEAESCGGCYQTLTTQTINQLQLSHLTHCPNCNAILYMPEDLRVR